MLIRIINDQLMIIVCGALWLIVNLMLNLWYVWI